KRDDVINRLKLQRYTLNVEVIALKSQLEALKTRPVPAARGAAAKPNVLSAMRHWIPQRSYR
ncbi:MAG: hypothetical protein WCB50_11740, partial [Pseudolabrys sp.]